MHYKENAIFLFMSQRGIQCDTLGSFLYVTISTVAFHHHCLCSLAGKWPENCFQTFE